MFKEASAHLQTPASTSTSPPNPRSVASASETGNVNQPDDKSNTSENILDALQALSRSTDRKAALSFEVPTGFGEWDVNFTDNALKHLRQLRSREPMLFEIVLKKLK